MINKIDAVKRPALLGLAQKIDAAGRFERVFMVSAQSGDGIADLRGWLASHMPEGPWLFPEDQLMELSERLFAADDAAGMPLPAMGLRRGRVMGSYAHVIAEAA